MSIENHIDALQKKHADKDAELKKELQRPRPDDLVVQHLKQIKLMLKDKIAAAGKNLTRMQPVEMSLPEQLDDSESVSTQPVFTSVHPTLADESLPATADCRERTSDPKDVKIA